MNEFKMPSPGETQAIVDQVRRERAAAYAAGIKKAARRVTGLLGSVASAFAEALRQRALYEELSRLSDRQLRDMGLNRGDIPAVVAGVYTRTAEATAPRAAAGPVKARPGAPAPAPVSGDRLAA